MRLLLRIVCVAVVAVTTIAAARSTTLIDAVKNGDATTVRAALRQPGVDVNATEVDGTSALHWAVERDDLEMVDALLRAGASVKAVNRYGVSPMAPAATNGNAAMIERLIKAGADPNVALPGGETALMTAARTGNVDAIKTLLAHGAKIDARETRRGQTALMWAASNNNAAAIRVLVEAGAELNGRATGPPSNSRTGLRRPAAPTGNDLGVGGYGANRTRDDQTSAFMLAVRRGHMESVKTLLDLGASAKEQLPDKTPALTVAIANGHFELASYLLDRGADPNDDAPGWAPLHQLARTRRGLDFNRYPPPEVTGTMSGLDLAKKLVAKGADINRKMKRKIQDDVRNNVGPGCTAFAMAAKASDLQLLKVLHALGADPNIRNVNETTPLMLAVGVEMFNPGEDTHDDDETVEVAKFLLSLDAPVNAKNRYGESAMLGATARGPIPLVQLLLDHGGSFDVEDILGWTPLISSEWGKNYGGQQLKNPEMGKYIREQMVKRGLPADRPSDDELYARMFGVCGHGANVKPAPPGGTLADRCKPGRDLRNVQRGNVPLPEDLAVAAK